MIAFVGKRALLGIVALLLASVLVFAMSRLTGDPVGLLLGSDATPAAVERLRESIGLNEPIHVQYLVFLRNAVQGDLGLSVRSGIPVVELVFDRLFASATLAVGAMAIVVLVGVPLGVLAAAARGGRLDSAARGIALVYQSAPSFVVGIILIRLFAVEFGILPASGAGTPMHYVLPAITLSLLPLAGIMRLTRSSMLGVLDSEYIKMARIKGVAERTVIWKHALRNALIPVAAFAALYFAIIITLGIVTEVVFNWPGTGRLAYDAILSRDFPVLQGVILVNVVIITLIQIFIDIGFRVIDPQADTTSMGRT